MFLRIGFKNVWPIRNRVGGNTDDTCWLFPQTILQSLQILGLLLTDRGARGEEEIANPNRARHIARIKRRTITLSQPKLANHWNQTPVVGAMTCDRIASGDSLVQRYLLLGGQLFSNLQEPLSIQRIIPLESISIAAPFIDQQNVVDVKLFIDRHLKVLFPHLFHLVKLSGKKRPSVRRRPKISRVSIENFRSIVFWIDRDTDELHVRFLELSIQHFNAFDQIAADRRALSEKEAHRVRLASKFARIKLVTVLVGQFETIDMW